MLVLAELDDILIRKGISLKNLSRHQSSLNIEGKLINMLSAKVYKDRMECYTEMAISLSAKQYV